MHAISRTVLAALAVATVLVGFQEARDGITADGIRGHLYFLARDELAGRAPGTRGGHVAAEYIKSQFVRMGLEPVDGSYFQDVPLAGVTPDPTTLSLAFEFEDGRLPAGYPAEAVIWPGTTHPSIQLTGDLVFVGYGIDAPEWDWNDYEGRDVTGKVVVCLVGDPPAPPDEPELFDGRALTYYGRWTYKFEEARRRGAVGALIVHTEEAAGYGWGVVRSSWTGEQLMLQDPGDGSPLLVKGWITRDLATRVFSQAGVDIAELYVQAARRDFSPVAVDATARARLNSHSRQVPTRNVIGYRPGSDPTVEDEAVVFSSHYDHLGIGPPVDGDSIYNGAYDNASGVGLLLEVAEAFAQLDDAPRRGTVFLATTAEEAGLLGSTYYVENPPFPLQGTVAAINVDGANLWGATRDVVALGADLSTLGMVLQPRAEELGLQVRLDPEPEKGGFFRSDHFPFARAGVPVLYIRHGLSYREQPDGWGDELMRRWSAEHYHQPSDEYSPTFDLAGAVQQARLVFGVGFDIANIRVPPSWLDDSSFRTARDSSRP